MRKPIRTALLVGAISLVWACGPAEAPAPAAPEVLVTDTGVGIAPEHLPRIFERFYRGNKDRSHEIPGTGLGLAIVKHLVEAHQGTVQAFSSEQSGTTLSFTLPTA